MTFCGAAQLWAKGTPDIKVNNPFAGYICNAPMGATDFAAGSGVGNGVLASLVLGGLNLDVFLGGGDVITLGNPQ